MVDRGSPVPLYQQIADDLAGALPTRFADGRLPSEAELVAAYGVSRITVRQALAHLAERGLLVRKQGKGTFVATPRVRQDLRRLDGFADVLAAQGLQPETHLLAFGIGAATARAREQLGLPTGEALGFRRQYLAEGRPIAVTEVYYPPALAAHITREAADRHSSYALLTRFARRTIGHAVLTIRVQRVAADLAQALGVPSDTAALVEERLTYDTTGQPLEHSTLYLHPDACELHLTVQPGLALTHEFKALEDGPPSPPMLGGAAYPHAGAGCKPPG
jgi:GntR family transcriptional regulator